MNSTKQFLVALTVLLSLAQLPAQADEAQVENQNPVMATVNGVPITADEVRHFLSKQSQPLAPEDAMRELINVELLNQAAKNEKLLENPTLQLEIKRLTSAVIASTYLQNHLNELEITDEQVEARYQKEYVDGDQASEYNANHILVKTEDEAKDIIKKLDDGGDFAELAKELSTGPSGKSGGALGWFKSEDMVTPFSEATMQLEKGQHSKTPVQTQFGWHVIKLNDTRKSEPPALDDVRKSLATGIAADSLKAKLEELHDAAKIEFPQQPQ